MTLFDQNFVFLYIIETGIIAKRKITSTSMLTLAMPPKVKAAMPTVKSIDSSKR